MIGVAFSSGLNRIRRSHRVVFSPRFIRDCGLGQSDFLGRQFPIMLGNPIGMT